MPTEKCQECGETVEVQNDRYVEHRVYVSALEEDYSEGNVHCRNMVERRCPASGLKLSKPSDRVYYSGPDHC